jgi:uncharacterized repeat protein (TIGR01451 family)
MKRSKQLLGAVSSTALIAFSASPAFAAGTTAGNSITNNVSVSFDVGGVTQTAVTDSDTFTVDRAIDVVVDFAGTGNTSVSPGESDVELAFDVTNSSNDVLDFNLAAALNAGTSGNIANFEIYLDGDGDRTLSAAELAAGPITSLDDVAADETVEVIVIADIGLGAGDGDTFDVVLTATALDSAGTALTQNTGANTAGEDTVFIDGAGTTDGNRDAAFSDVGTYEVAGAQMSVAKSSSIIEDPVNGTTNPKAIPGATIEYCIVVSNAAGAATATDVAVNDVLPADVSYLSSFGIYVDGDGSCASGSRGDTGATPTASYNSTDHEIDAGLSDVAASGQRSVYFRVTID